MVLGKSKLYIGGNFFLNQRPIYLNFYVIYCNQFCNGNAGVSYAKSLESVGGYFRISLTVKG